jgi:hypothetical protein
MHQPTKSDFIPVGLNRLRPESRAAVDGLSVMLHNERESVDRLRHYRFLKKDFVLCS